MSEHDPRDELAALVSGFRAHLEWHARAGAHGAPGAASPVTEVELDAGDGSAEAAAASEVVGSAPAPSPSPAEIVDDRADEPAPRRRLTLAEVEAELGDCQRCKLSRTRKNIVFGVGDPSASLVFVGEAPGYHEDMQGEPFVGPAGQLLDKMIGAMGWTRDTVYILNVLKCRPPNNRNPEPDEVEACEPFLARQIEAIAPRVIVTLGKPAAHLLLRTNAPISALRGRFQNYRGITVMPTFHPAYLLRSPERKRETWDDLKQVIAEIERRGIATPHSART